MHEQDRTDMRILGWPRQMRAETAARYVDEASTATFLAAAGNQRGKLYPAPRVIVGKGKRWLIEDLDQALDRIHGRNKPGGGLSELV